MQHNDNNPCLEDVSIPVKITDSIFMGDEVIAQDIEWLTLNQITHVINCAGRHCQNNSTVKGMCFLTFDWAENNIQNIIDQNVINAVVGFVEEAKRQHGTVLIHGWHSESRPFCLLAIYFIIKFHWNIYKALQYLNARREGTQVDQVFIHQLNTLHSRLLERGLIRSKQWVITPDMADQQILLHNTFLNSRKKQPQDVTKGAKKKRKTMKSIAWKQNLSTEHQYSQNTPIASNAPSRPSMIEPKPRSQSTNSRKGDENKGITGKILTAKQSLKADKNSLILTEMNVTKKWTELKEAWTKEKQNLNQNCSTCTIYLILRSRGLLTLLCICVKNKKQTIDSMTRSTFSRLKPSCKNKLGLLSSRLTPKTT